jgi:hypothetical protein
MYTFEQSILMDPSTHLNWKKDYIHQVGQWGRLVVLHTQNARENHTPMETTKVHQYCYKPAYSYFYRS